MRLAPRRPHQAIGVVLRAATDASTRPRWTAWSAPASAAASPIYRLDNEAVRELRPDLVLTQDLCAVCAVPSGHVNEALELLGCRAEVLSMDPSSLGDVLDCLVQVGAATGTESDGHRRSSTVLRGQARTSSPPRWPGGTRPRTFALEWSDPPFNGGHWVPEMIELAGGEAVLASRGTPSVRVTWEQIVSASPEVVVFMPCGYDLEGAVVEATPLLERAELAGRRRSSPSTPVRTSHGRDPVSSTGWRSWRRRFIPVPCRRALPGTLRRLR